MNNGTDTPQASGTRWLLPPALFLVALLLEVTLHVAWPVMSLVAWPWRLIGFLLIVAGLAVMIMADAQFKRSHTTIHPFGTPSVLVTDGMFRFSRNPMYVGMVAILIGCAIALGSMTPLFVPPAFACLLAWRFILPEERMLGARFGASYADYQRRVRRWI